MVIGSFSAWFNEKIDDFRHQEFIDAGQGQFNLGIVRSMGIEPGKGIGRRRVAANGDPVEILVT